ALCRRQQMALREDLHQSRCLLRGPESVSHQALSVRIESSERNRLSKTPGHPSELQLQRRDEIQDDLRLVRLRQGGRRTQSLRAARGACSSRWMDGGVRSNEPAWKLAGFREWQHGRALDPMGRTDSAF